MLLTLGNGKVAFRKHETFGLSTELSYKPKALVYYYFRLFLLNIVGMLVYSYNVVDQFTTI